MPGGEIPAFLLISKIGNNWREKAYDQRGSHKLTGGEGAGPCDAGL